jgi:hypothetical protein
VGHVVAQALCILVPGAAPVGFTSKRQWQKAQAQNLARAGLLPAKVKKSSVTTAPCATSINRPTSPVPTGSGAAIDARKAGQRGGGRLRCSGHRYEQPRPALVGVPACGGAWGGKLGSDKSLRAIKVAAVALAAIRTQNDRRELLRSWY